MNATPFSVSRRMTRNRPFELGIGEDGGWLVEHDQPGVSRERFRDLDHLPSATLSVPTRRRGSRSRPKPLGDHGGLLGQPPPIDEPAAPRSAAGP